MKPKVLPYRAELLEVVQSWAAMMFSEDDIAFSLELTPDERNALTTTGHPFALAVRRGRLQAEATVRKKLLEMAQAGDERAIARYQELISDAKLWK